MKRALFAALTVAMAVQPMAADAQLYNGSPPALTQFDFVSAAGSVAGTFGVYVGPYTGNFIGDGVGAFSVYCVDYLHYASQSDGESNVSQLSGSLDNTRLAKTLTDTDALLRYRKAAYLSSLFESWGAHSSGGTYSQTEVFSGLHAAIWNISSGVNVGTSGDTGNRRTYFLGLAGQQANWESVNLDDWYVITRTSAVDGFGISGDGKGQEFLMRRASVPEPATLLMILSGMAMLIGVRRRRIVSAEDC